MIPGLIATDNSSSKQRSIHSVALSFSSTLTTKLKLRRAENPLNGLDPSLPYSKDNKRFVLVTWHVTYMWHVTFRERAGSVKKHCTLETTLRAGHVLKPETPKRNHRNETTETTETTETAETKPPKPPKRPKRPKRNHRNDRNDAIETTGTTETRKNTSLNDEKPVFPSSVVLELLIWVVTQCLVSYPVTFR